MFVRDFSIFIRDRFSIPQTANVTLCDALTGKPHKGLHWLLPRTALQIKIDTISTFITPTPNEADGGAGIRKPAALQEEEMGDETFSGDDSSDSVASSSGNAVPARTHHVFLDAIVTVEGHGIGGIHISSGAVAGNDTPPTVFPSVQNIGSTKACDLYFFQAAMEYIKIHLGKRVAPHIYCASIHVTNACPTAHYIDLDTPELTRIRKACVFKYKQSSV